MMNAYLYHIKKYMVEVLHPAEGKKASACSKKKEAREQPRPKTPDCYNIRGRAEVKQGYAFRSPAP